MIFKTIINICLIYKTFVTCTKSWPVNMSDISHIISKTPIELTTQTIQRIESDAMQDPNRNEDKPKDQRMRSESNVPFRLKEMLRNSVKYNTDKSKQNLIINKRAQDKRKLQLNQLLTILSNSSIVKSIQQKRVKPKTEGLRTSKTIEQAIPPKAKSVRNIMDKSEKVTPVNIRSNKVKPTVEEKEIEEAKDVPKLVKTIRAVKKRPLHLKEWANFDATDGKSNKPVGRGGGMGPLPHADILDMAAAKGHRLNSMRVKGRLCHRHVLLPEGPKYDRRGRAYLRPHQLERGLAPPFPRTRRPRLLLPSCCNCCRKSVLGCE